ncbi:hypothetical protein MTO98_07280 [Mucilaginibacter sp. SMC90]|nr:hypothetical protein [Mucilaginibacter sp. SMC90]UOE50878.1 hypothetical protein MTO98_07280 [Mucilaginibacter sp. SMC90]
MIDVLSLSDTRNSLLNMPFHYTLATFGYILEPAAAELCFNKDKGKWI